MRQYSGPVKLKKPLAIVVLGVSGAGKDTACRLLSKHARVTNIKFARPFKDFLEDLYLLEPGSLDDNDFKEHMSPAGCTWGALMVRWWRLSPELDPQMWLRRTVRQVALLNTSLTPVFTDTRNMPEVDFLLSMRDRYQLIGLRVWRDRAVPKASDANLPAIANTLEHAGVPTGHVHNSGQLAQFESELVRVLNALRMQTASSI